MASLEDLLHPISVADFQSEYEGRKPLHIPADAGGRKHEALTWSAFNALLNQSALWTAQNLILIRDHVGIPVEQYCQPTPTPNGMVLRPSAQKVEVFLSAGASVVLNDVGLLHPPLAAISETLARQQAGTVGANVYCSFQGVRAFGTHFDNHDVFVIQTEGEKVWNVYEGRAENPVEPVADTTDARRWFEKTRGKLLAEVLMRPGDVLYLPRGCYHDALAKDGPSLHVTFSVDPLHGRSLMPVLDRIAMQHPAFRAYLAPAHRDGGAPLKANLEALASLLAEIVRSPAFAEDVAMAQERLVPRPSGFALPERKSMSMYRTTGAAFPPASRIERMTYDWAIEDHRFALEDMVAHFNFIPEDEVRAAVAKAEQAGALQRL